MSQTVPPGTAIAVRADGSVVRAQGESASLLDVIARAAADPNVDVAKMERLLAMQEKVTADNRRTAFAYALARLQARMPQIAKSGTITDRDGAIRNRFAKIEDIDAVIRPLCAEEGFAFAFDSTSKPPGIEYSCTMSHREGHSETKTINLPADTGAGRNAVQSIGSTTSYARRYLLGMHLNLVTRDEDDDGNAHGAEPVTADQAAELRAKLAEAGGSEERFLRWIGAATFEEILSGKYKIALKFIDEKRRAVTK